MQQLTVNASQLQSLAAIAIAQCEPLLVVGPPGAGKTDSVIAAANAANAQLMMTHAVTSDVTDPKGLPAIINGGADFIPFGNLRRAMDTKTPLVWFFDDFGQAAPSVQAAYMQLFLAREINGNRVSDQVTFAAATNRRSDRAGVSGILEPVKSRFMILHYEPSTTDWLNWAMKAGINPWIRFFIQYKPDALLQEVRTGKNHAEFDMCSTATPRGWARLSRWLATSIERDTLLQVAAGCIGPEHAGDFVSFMDLADRLPNPDDVLRAPEQADVPTESKVMFALMASLSTRVNAETVPGFGRYLKRVTQESSFAELTAFAFNAALQRDPALLNTDAAIDLATGAIAEVLA